MTNLNLQQPFLFKTVVLPNILIQFVLLWVLCNIINVVTLTFNTFNLYLDTIINLIK